MHLLEICPIVLFLLISQFIYTEKSMNVVQTAYNELLASIPITGLNRGPHVSNRTIKPTLLSDRTGGRRNQ